MQTCQEEEFTAESTEKKRMTVITIEQAGKYAGQEVTIRGWLYNLRESGKLVFPIFRDGTGIIQGVCALKENGVDFLLDHRHLWMRTPRQAAILRIRAEAERAAREFMDSQDYTLTDAPIFTPAACEGTSTLFEVNYIDDEKAYLTQSGQLYIEAT